jgi:hypothetical protein
MSAIDARRCAVDDIGIGNIQVTKSRRRFEEKPAANPGIIEDHLAQCKRAVAGRKKCRSVLPHWVIDRSTAVHGILLPRFRKSSGVIREAKCITQRRTVRIQKLCS